LDLTVQDAVYPKPDPSAWQSAGTASAPPQQPSTDTPSRRAAEPQQQDILTPTEASESDAARTALELQGAEETSPVPDWAPPAMMLMGVALLTWLTLRSFLRRARHPTQPSEPRERIEAIRKQAGARAQIDSFSADAQELTQRLAAQLDAKAARIQLLLEEAEEAVRRLERAKRAVDAAPSHPETRALEQAEDNPLSNQVYRLADEGHSTLEIARRLNQHVGQIELMLALRRA